MRTKSLQSIVVTASCFLASCGSSNQSSPGASAGGSGQGGGALVGGSPANGGSVANGGGAQSGGVTSNGGSSTGAGGVAPSGGITGAGGSSTAGGGVAPSGGVATTGGSKAAGGSAATGAVTSTGGSNAAGGTKAGGGTSSAAGGTAAVGGTAAAGGTAATTGGTKAAGGTAATGGTTANGGSSTCAAPTVTLTGADAVAGTKITFNDNGGWCWYQDERALVDTQGGKLVVGSVASGGSRNGYIEAVVYDLTAKTSTRYTVSTSLAGGTVDDHNAPAFLVRPDGKYLATYCSHRNDCITRASIFDGTKWGTEYKFDWTSLGCPWPSTSTPNTNLVTYNNPWYMGTSIYDGIRSVDTDNAFLSSTDDGATFSYYGRLMATKQVGYVAGYYKYWGNNTDRIDFVGTEAHPRDADNSLWHGYIQGGQVYNSTGTVIDSSLKDSSSTTTNSKDISAYTQVFKTGSTINGVVLNHAWDHDIVRYADGTIAILGQARVNGTGTDDPDKRMLYFRFDGTSWKATYLAKGGSKLYADEQDYIGLSALVPDDPTTIYISTPYNPTTDTMGSSGKHEIWRGTTCDNGATFTWTPVTANSTKDNLRPIVPKWDASHTALLWMQGTYTSAQSFATAIVGIVK